MQSSSLSPALFSDCLPSVDRAHLKLVGEDYVALPLDVSYIPPFVAAAIASPLYGGCHTITNCSNDVVCAIVAEGLPPTAGHDFHTPFVQFRALLYHKKIHPVPSCPMVRQSPQPARRFATHPVHMLH